MARTNRSAASVAAHSDPVDGNEFSNGVDDLDHLNLDAMFEGDDVALFDDLDIDLDNMDDIAGIDDHQDQLTPMAQKPAQPATTTFKIINTKGPPKLGQLPITDSTAKRKGTKRKLKPPILHEDEPNTKPATDTFSEPPKKKSKKSLAIIAPSAKMPATTKKNTSASLLAQLPQITMLPFSASGVPSAKDKSHLKKPKANRTISSIPPSSSSSIPNVPMSRFSTSVTGVNSNVAAAGQFGGRNKRAPINSKNRPTSHNSASSIPKYSSKPTPATASAPLLSSTTLSSMLSTSKTGTKASAFPNAAPINTISSDRTNPIPTTKLTPHAAALQTLHHQQQHAYYSFCGLKSSNCLFYPFLPVLPPEPSIKNRKVFPLLDQILAAFTNFLVPGNLSTSIVTSDAVVSKETIDNNMNGTSNCNGSSVTHKASFSDAIFQFLQDTYTDEKPATNDMSPPQDMSATSTFNPLKAELAVLALESMRAKIVEMDRTKLAGDLYAVCALLKRQHDFLKQNNANMEKWCRNNFSKEDYDLVFDTNEGNRKRKSGEALQLGDDNKNMDPTMSPFIDAPSLLSTLSRSTMRVRLRCVGFKEQKNGRTLVAVVKARQPLPTSINVGVPVDKSTSKSTKKKKPALNESVKPFQGTASSLLATETVVKDVPVSYGQMLPGRRRKNVTEMIARTARELEMQEIKRQEELCSSAPRGFEHLPTSMNGDSSSTLHTTEMWQAFESAKYFRHFSAADVHQRLDGISDTHQSSPQLSSSMPYGEVDKTSSSSCSIDQATGLSAIPSENNRTLITLFERVQSLLVDTHDDDSEDERTDDDGSELLDSDSETSVERLDLSMLSFDERLFLNAKAVGLFESLDLPPNDTVKIDECSSLSHNAYQAILAHNKHTRSTPCDDDIHDTIHAMVSDLHDLEKLNSRRACFLYAATRPYQTTFLETKRIADEESSLLSKSHQLLKKSKELKVKSVKPKPTKNDATTLPW